MKENLAKQHVDRILSTIIYVNMYLFFLRSVFILEAEIVQQSVPLHCWTTIYQCFINTRIAQLV
jgi:hypothetical protein